mgnify:FL=1
MLNLPIPASFAAYFDLLISLTFRAWGPTTQLSCYQAASHSDLKAAESFGLCYNNLYLFHYDQCATILY